MSKTLLIGTRPSPLAIIQTNEVVDWLKNFYPDLTFDIVEINSYNNIFRNNLDIFPKTLPNTQHINSIIKFTSNISNNENTVIHCWCGVSRSMATATYLLCKQDIKNIDRNVRYIRSLAPHANPNKLMIKLFEKKLNLNDQITDAYKRYPYSKI